MNAAVEPPHSQAGGKPPTEPPQTGGAQSNAISTGGKQTGGKQIGESRQAHTAQSDRAAGQLEGRPVEEILGWTASRFPGRVTFATGFGVEGCVLIDAIARHGLAIDVFTLDTGLLFGETYSLWRRLEDHYGILIRAVRPNQTVLEQAKEHGERLWESDPDRCCRLRKVLPLSSALAGLGAWITAIRREQTPDRAQARVVEHDESYGLLKVNPLVAWTADDVWGYVRAHGVPVNPLHTQGYPSIGCRPCTSPVLPGERARAGRWRGREKTECGLHARPAERSLTISSTRGA